MASSVITICGKKNRFFMDCHFSSYLWGILRQVLDYKAPTGMDLASAKDTSCLLRGKKWENRESQVKQRCGGKWKIVKLFISDGFYFLREI